MRLHGTFLLVSYGVIAGLVDPVIFPRTPLVLAAELPPVRRPSLQSPSVSAVQENYLRRVLNPQQREELASMGRGLARNPSYGAVQSQWTQFVSQLSGGAGEPVDINALVQFVLRESYLQTNKDLESYAEKVKYFNEVKKKLREELAQARRHAQPSAVTRLPPGRAAADKPQAAAPTPTSRSSVPHNTSTAAVSDLEIRNLDSRLVAAEKDEQLANLELQKQMNKRQQTLQTLSNVAKQMHDTAMSIIRKIGG